MGEEASLRRSANKTKTVRTSTAAPCKSELTNLATIPKLVILLDDKVNCFVAYDILNLLLPRSGSKMTAKKKESELTSARVHIESPLPEELLRAE